MLFGFRYLQSEEKLLEFVTDILTLRDTIPKVILIEGLDELTAVGDSRDSDHCLGRVCAIVSHVMFSCATHVDLSLHLLVTVATTIDRLPPAVCSIFDSVWAFENFRLTRTLPIESSPNPVLTLASRADGACVLREVSHLFVNSAR